MEVLLLLVAGAANIACFIVGAKVGQAVKNGEKVETPTVNLLKSVAEHQNRRAAQKEQSRLDTIIRNMEAYDGTGRGQEDVPGGVSKWIFRK